LAEPLRVLVLAPTPFFADRGCHVRILEEARAALGCGVELRLVTYHIGRDVPGIATDRIPQIPWYKKLAAGPSWHKPYLDILLFFKALKVARSFRPHLIHAHIHEGAFIGIFVKKLLGIPLVFDCQGSLTAEIVDHGFAKEGSLLQRFFTFLERRIDLGADYVITSSTPTARLLLKGGVPGARLQPLLDGVDTDVFSPHSKAIVRERLSLPADRPIVCYLGILSVYQGVDLLLEAAARLKQQGAKIHFLIMGFPEGGYAEMAASLGVAEMVTFTGRIPYHEAPLYLCAGDIAVSAKVSLTEANGKLFNYMACALPTVVFDTPVNREILGDAALYAKLGDAADFAAAIGRLAGDRELRAELGDLAREKAIAEHSWQARGRELIAVYRKTLEGKSR